MKKLILINLALIVIILSSNCTTEGQNILGVDSTKNITENDDIFMPQNFSDSLSICAVKLTKSDKIIISHNSLSRDMINNIEFIKISNMFI